MEALRKVSWFSFVLGCCCGSGERQLFVLARSGSVQCGSHQAGDTETAGVLWRAPFNFVIKLLCFGCVSLTHM